MTRSFFPDRLPLASAACIAALLAFTAALAGTPQDQGASAQGPAQPGAADQPVAAGMSQRTDLLGEMDGIRPALGRYGVTLNLAETDEVLGNVTGGTRHATDYDGLTTASVSIDTRAAFGLPGGTLFASALQQHGRNLSVDSLLTLQTASGIEADRATRLWELWYDQKFWDNQADVKIGQQSLDQEFIVSTNALLFVNTSFGWPLVPSVDLPGGGPAYPLSSLGIRLRAQVSPNVTILGGVYNGSPTAKFNTGDPQLRNASGTSFPLNGDQLLIGELQYSFPGQGELATPDERPPLAGSYKLGCWVDTESFADERYDATGLSLADPASNGTPLGHRDNWSIYGVADQTVWQPAGGKILNAFVRAMGAPDDRNLVTFSLNAGLVLHDPWLGRSADTAGLAMGYGRVGNFVRGLDLDTRQQTGTGLARSDETFVELTYQYVPYPWWQIQPDVQYVFNPGGGISDPDAPTTRRVRNETVLGLRSNITF